MIHVSQMYLERYVSEMQDTCEIHAKYMHSVIKIHAGYIARYMMRYMYLKCIQREMYLKCILKKDSDRYKCMKYGTHQGTLRIH
jgi:hypothetical protein